MCPLRALANGNLWIVLLILCAICAKWNWQAALMFALAIGVGQATARYGLSQIHLLAGYTLLAVVACFFIDRYSGFILAAIGLVIGAHMAGLMDHKTKIIAGEMLLIAGMLVCGFAGPSGGLFSRNVAVSSDRPDPAGLVRSRLVARASKPDQENL